ncbi:MAG: PspC domain-containing protein [Bacteroidales bacterium]|nr:PspC domain-containing protein [Bacteroidales bacterium]
MAYKKLYRSNTDKRIAGVCSGLSEFLDFDPTAIRIIFIILAIFGGSGIIIYLIMWLLLPEKPFSLNMDEDKKKTEEPDSINFNDTKLEPEVNPVEKKTQNKGSLFFALLLILLGLLLLFNWVFNFSICNFWPIILILAGVLLLAGSFNKK